MDFLIKFGETLEELMDSQDLSSSSLSQILSIDRSSIPKYCRGEIMPTVKTAVLIADYFQCSLDYLFGRTDEINKRAYEMTSTFSESFQKILKRNDCTRYRLCRALKFREAKVDAWYHGTSIPTFDNVMAIANYFDVTLDELVGRAPV